LLFWVAAPELTVELLPPQPVKSDLFPVVAVAVLQVQVLMQPAVQALQAGLR
jgi:hypothetical protein